MRTILIYDIKLQWRQGFWAIYTLLAIVFLLIIFSLPNENRQLAASLFVLSDTSMLGIMFIGALVLFEKQQNVLQSFFVSPLRLSSYLWSKTCSLGLLIFCMSLLIYLPSCRIDRNIITFLFVVLCSSATFTLMGLGLSARVKTVNQYFLLIIGASVLIVLPIVAYFVSGQMLWMAVFPNIAAIELIQSPIKNHSPISYVFYFAMMLLWNLLAYYFAYYQFKQHVLTR